MMLNNHCQNNGHIITACTNKTTAGLEYPSPGTYRCERCSEIITVPDYGDWSQFFVMNTPVLPISLN